MARIIEGNRNNMIGPKVRQLRKEQHLSQQELSARLETYAIMSAAVPFPESKMAAVP